MSKKVPGVGNKVLELIENVGTHKSWISPPKNNSSK